MAMGGGMGFSGGRRPRPPGGYTCFNCMQEGHVQKDCTNPPFGGECFNCGQQGHVFKDCINPRKPREGEGRSGGGVLGIGFGSGGGGFGESTVGEGGNGGDQKLSILECAICFDKYKSGVKIPKVLNCGHTFCDGCIKPMIKDNRLKCPTCREDSIAPQAGFPKNFALLSLIDEEETRAKSFKYNCSDCSIGLTMDSALLCERERDHNGVICVNCYSTNHGDHGGVYSFKFTVNENRPTFEQAVERLKEKYETYKAMESHFGDQRQMSIVDSWINRLISMNDSITSSMDSLRAEMDEIKRVLDQDGSRLLEILTMENEIGSFAADSLENAKCYGDLEFVRGRFKFLEAALSEKAFEMKQQADNTIDNRQISTAHMFRPYLNLLESRDQTRGNEIAGTSSASSSQTQTQTPAIAPFTYSTQDFRLVQGGGEGTSGRGGFGGMSGAIASSASIHIARGRGHSNRGRPSAD